MERFYMNKSTVCRYGRDRRADAVHIVDEYGDFSQYDGAFYGFLADKLSTKDCETVIDKIRVLGLQATKHFYRIIANEDPKYNKVALPNVDLFREMYNAIRNGQKVDGQNLTAKELADAFVSSLDQCITENYNAIMRTGALAVNEKNPLEKLGWGLSDKDIQPYRGPKSIGH